jgi:peroxiredoxin
MKTIYCILLALFLSPLAGNSQNTVITGTAPGAEGKTIKVIKFADLVTYLEETIASATIDSSGNFTLTFDPKETIYTIIAIDFHRSDLYIEPGKTYNLKIEPMVYDESVEINPFIQSQTLNMNMINPGLNELNIWITDYNQKYDQYLLDHFNILYLERSKPALDTFRMTINALFTQVDIPYFRNYVVYKTAGLVQLARAMNQYQLAKTYFTGKPILYNNVEYMRFFNNFYAKYLQTSNILRKVDFTALLKGPQPYKNMLKAMAPDTLIRDAQLRELVLLKGLMEIFYDNADLQENVITAIAEATLECTAEENRGVATDMMKRMSKLRSGTIAPEFGLPDRNHKKVTLKEFRGKPVLLNFWTTYCQGCLTEMEMMGAMYSKYKDRAGFISISADRDFIKMQYFLKMKPNFNWTFLHLDNQSDLLVDYDVRSYPLFVLIDKKGNIYKYPAPLPSEGLEKMLIELMAQ